jgi:hypothetical protein
MAFKVSPDKEKFEVRCLRCHGPMASEKFFDNSRSFYGWHCVLCGEILDPVILLHRVSQNPNIAIPEGEEEILLLIKKYLTAKPKRAMN